MTSREWGNTFVARTERHESGCWLWTGPTTRDGYGTSYDGYKKGPEKAHRIAYRMCYGPIPAGLEIDHLCFVRNCVNPAHLEAVTVQENRRRRKDNLDLTGDLRSGQVCRLLGVSQKTVSNWVRKGILPCSFTPSGQRSFRREDIDALITHPGAA